jgi:hypothetical protein
MISESLFRRILAFAEANRHRLVWKRRLHALCWGAGLPILNKIKDEETT